MNVTRSLTTQEQRAIDLFRGRLSAICGTKEWEIRLFGSRARGEGGAESDLDLLVLVEGLDEELKMAIWDAAYGAFDETEVLLSPLVLSRTQFDRLRQRERLIARDIENDGIRL